MDERVERIPEAHRLRRNLFVPVAALLAATLGIVLLSTTSSTATVFAALLVWFGGWVAPLTLLRNSFPLARRTSLVATPRSLTIEGEVPIPVEHISEARSVPRAVRDGNTVVELVCKGRGRLRFALHPVDAERLVTVLGTTAGERRAAFTRIFPFTVRFLWTVGLVGVPWFLYLLADEWRTDGGVLPLFFILPMGILPVCAAIATVLGVLRGKVVVGAEGFTTSWYGLRRTQRFADVDLVERKPKGVGGSVVDMVVHMRSKKRVAISILDAPDTHAQRGAETRAFADTLEEAFERWRRAPAVAELGTHLGRGQRSAEEWLAGIDQLIRGGGNHYRIAAVTPEVLADVARSTEVSTDTRVGAATALLRLGDDAHRVTVRVAAEACAEPKTREALLELVEAEGDEHKLEVALARVR